MLSVGKPKTAGSAKDYFKDEYAHASPHTENERIVGRWNGELAEQFGLKDHVTEEQFLRLANGQDPRTGEQLVRRVKSHKRTNKFGDVRRTRGHRAGVDIVLSAPKSVTLAAVVGGDERIFVVHHEASRAAIREVERCLQARLGGNKLPETTGKAIIATFPHDTARPDKKSRYAAPDLHTPFRFEHHGDCRRQD